MIANENDLRSATWHKSSYSNGDGGNCVEVARDFPGAARWHKSSYSNGTGGNCVEVAVQAPGGVVPVRDSKQGGGGPVVGVSGAAWGVFVAAVRDRVL
ncbi:DUF397 domain-containing protein [Streptomyces boncukensis]|uniref:DUF397 domain-containing protein n=1 Tax=Streptomyces boncukensis TaxID=2711219 RepID=A0A6G4WVV1_9ACTN|nr:DUF397 domain-containing protein [Streptomyces boncukensis]NGO68664.1 DUF397 domain-containing protein [Streptomyces boncukensis]